MRLAGRMGTVGPAATRAAGLAGAGLCSVSRPGALTRPATGCELSVTLPGPEPGPAQSGPVGAGFARGRDGGWSQTRAGPEPGLAESEAAGAGPARGHRWQSVT